MFRYYFESVCNLNLYRFEFMVKVYECCLVVIVKVLEKKMFRCINIVYVVWEILVCYWLLIEIVFIIEGNNFEIWDIYNVLCNVREMF